MTTEIATTTATSTDLTLAPDQRGFTEPQIAALAQLGLEDVPDGDLQVFFHQAKRTGLDPFARQIYMIGRPGGEVEVDEVNPNTGNTRRVKRRVTKYTIQIGIDGYRLLTRRAADSNGDTIGMEGPLWCDDDGVWRDVWPEGKPPVAAKFILYRNGEAFPFVAHYSEYVQTRYDRDSGQQVPNAMWSKMPRNQLAKCAEVGACRRAYPADFAGLVFAEAAVIDEDGNVVQEARRKPAARARGVDKLRDRAAEAAGRKAGEQFAEAVDAEVVDHEPKREFRDADSCGMGDEPNPETAPAPDPEPAPAPKPDADIEMSPETRGKGEAMLANLLGEAQADGDDWPAVVSEIVALRGESYRRVEAVDDLSNTELKFAVDALRSHKQRDRLDAYVGESLNAAALREAGFTAEGN